MDASAIITLVSVVGVCLISLGIAVGPIGRALADRLRQGKLPRPEQSAGSSEVLREEVEQLRGQVEDLHERLDFAERLLAQARERGQLGAGNGR